MPPAPPVRRGTSPIVWVLCIIGGLFFLAILGTFAVGYWFVRNPGFAIAKLINAANPNAEVLNVDNANRQVTIRDRRDGKEVTISFDDVKNGRFSLSAVDENGKVGHVELGAGAGKLPAWVPVYPGARIESHVTGAGDDGDHAAEGGLYSFSSPDPPAQVMNFYQDKARDLGMKVGLTTATAEGGHITAADDEDNRSLIVLVGTANGGSSGTVTFKRKR